MQQFYSQILIAALSLLGFVALLAGPDKNGTLRLQGVANRIVSTIGIAFLLLPWLILPALSQPRMEGVLAPFIMTVGILIVFAGLALYAVALYFLWPAFKKNYSEFTPQALITGGPYQWLRHPIYLAALTILFGIDAACGATYSLALMPAAYALFRVVTLYEERRILTPSFGEAYGQYKAAVPVAILPRHWLAILALLCWIPAIGRLI